MADTFSASGIGTIEFDESTALRINKIHGNSQSDFTRHDYIDQCVDPMEEYIETDDFVKGPCGNMGGECESEFPKEGLRNGNSQSASTHHGVKGKCVPEFANQVAPPPLPKDVFFELDVCSLLVLSDEIWVVYNSLLAFFGNKDQCVSDILKPDATNRKYSIKAHVFEQAMTCTVKIQIYEESEGRYWVEFQRRSGDCVSFNTIYVRAAKFLNEAYPLCVQNLPWDFERDDVPTGGVLELPEEVDDVDFHLNPLLGMADMHGSKQLQSEAAMALAEFAKEPKAREPLCTDNVFDRLEKLVKVEDTAVAFPAARAFALLAPERKAAELLERKDFRNLVSERENYWSGKSRLVQKELQAVADALRVVWRVV